MNLKEVYDQDFFLSLSSSLNKFCDNFNKAEFMALIFDDEWKNRELKQRMKHIVLVLNQILSKDYVQNVEILKKVAKDVKITSPYSGLSLIIFANYVEIFGLENFDVSMKALEFFTEFGSSEFAVRHFFVKNPNKTLEYFLQWSKSGNYHIRRLASEGSRSRLPWGIALQELKKDPTPIIPILENLKNDGKEYVRRSVANNLNDISKDNPEIVLSLAKLWLQNGDENIQKLVKHGLRTLLKSSNKRALELFGYKDIKNPIESFFLKQNKINLGQDLCFSFNLSLKKQAKIRLEYVIYFLRKDQKFSRKVFQITQKEFEKGDYVFNKKHSFKEITTRKYYQGLHKIALLANGLEGEGCQFFLQLSKN